MAQRAGGDDYVGPLVGGVLQDLAAQVQGDFQVAEGQRATAAVGLVRPIDGFGADGFHEIVHVGGVLGVLGAGDVGRAGEQATIIAGHLEPFQGLDDRFCGGLIAYPVGDGRQQVVHLDAASVLKADVLSDSLAEFGVLLHLVYGRAKAGETGRTGHGHVAVAQVAGDGQGLHGQLDGPIMVGVVGRRGAAADPAFRLDQVEAQDLGDGQSGHVEFDARGVEAAAGVVRDDLPFGCRCCRLRGPGIGGHHVWFEGFLAVASARLARDAGKEFELARAQHVDRQLDVVFEELAKVELAGEKLADVKLGHQAQLPHPAKQINGPVGRLVEHGHCAGFGFDPLLGGHDLQHVHDGGDVNALRAARGAGLAGGADGDSP